MELPKKNSFEFKPADYDSEPYYHILKRFPAELGMRLMKYAEDQEMSDEEITHYLSEQLEGRLESTTNSEISDAHIQELAAGHEKELFHALETSVFTNPDNYLGTGMTARVKSHYVGFGDEIVPMAIKYVVTPTAKTITAEQEHNVIKEVERMRMIEEAEIKFERRSKYIRVPHPYLYHTTDSIQLYGMELIDGITLEQASAEGMLHAEFKEALKNSRLADLQPEEMNGYIRRFFETMHQYCLHGDIKPRNIMISREGILYVIDFGQSVMVHNIPGGAEERVENLKEDEIKQTQFIVQSMLRKVFAE